MPYYWYRNPNHKDKTCIMWIPIQFYIKLWPCLLIDCMAIPAPIHTFCQSEPYEQTAVKIWIRIYTFLMKIYLKILSANSLPFYSGLNVLTLNMQKPSYLGLTRSISWLLMPWLLTSPGHQQPWYCLYRIYRSFSYLRKDFKYLCQINVEEWHKMQIYVYVPS